ncbi:MAG: MFS transporter [Thermoleophilia bacterium]
MLNTRAAIRRLSAARAISVTGSQVAMIALTFQIYELTNSAVWVSAVFLATFAALGILTPIGGWLGDTYDRRMVMIISDVAAAAVFVGLVFADQPWMLVGLALLATMAEVPFLPASQAAIPNLASDEDLAWANGLVSQAFALGITVGPLIGGVLVGAVGTGAAFGINAVSFLVSAFLVWSVRGRFQERARDTAAGDVPFMEGIRLVFRTRILLIVVAAEVVAYSIVGWAMVSDAPLAKLFGVGSIGFAALISTWGIGMLMGSWVAGRRMGQRPIEIPLLFFGMIVDGVMIAAIGLSPIFVMALVVSVFGGAASGMVNVARQTFFQRAVPDRIRSRVFSVAEVVATASFILGLATAGPVIEALGVRVAYVLAGVVFVLGALVLLPALRHRGEGVLVDDDLPSA